MRKMGSPAVTRVVEDYVTLIWKAFEWPDGGPTTTELAAQLDVTPSTVSSTLKKLARDGFIEYEPYGAISLTDAGRRVALRIVRRHRLLETYLARALHVPWDEVHAEADRLEHVISDTLLERMDAVLGHPVRDPHGHPIPDVTGAVVTEPDQALADVAPGMQARITRVSDRSSELLRYLESLGLTVGVQVRVETVSAAADAVTITVDGEPAQLSTVAAAALRVAPL